MLQCTHSVVLVDDVQKEEGLRRGHIYEKMVDEEYDECEDPPEMSFYGKDGVEWSKNPGYTSNVLEGEVVYSQNGKQDMTSTAIGGTDTEYVIDSLDTENVIESLYTEYVIESLDTENVIESLDTEYVIESLDTENVIESLDTEYVIESLDTEYVIESQDTENVIESEQAEVKYMNVSEEPVQDATLIQNATFEDQTEEEYVNTSENCTNPLKDTASSITPPVEEEYMSMD